MPVFAASSPPLPTAFRVLFTVLAALAVAALVLTLLHRRLKRRVTASMQLRSDTLVGQRAIVVEDLRPGGVGSIRAVGTPKEETARSMRDDGADAPPVTFPAVADQFISRGRIVRVTGGDRAMYRVRPDRLS